MKKYYVGAKHIGAAVNRNEDAGCTRDTMAEAIGEAQDLIRSGESECLVIVKIVAVVKKEYPPVTVKYVE